MNIRNVAVAGLCALMLGGLASSSVGQDQDMDKLIQEWLIRYHDKDTVYIEYPNGLIAKAGWFGKIEARYLDTVVLYLCSWPTFFDRRNDANLYLSGKAVQWTDPGGDKMAGRYATQCQLRKFRGGLRTNLAKQ
jgi:hypothetical protein